MNCFRCSGVSGTGRVVARRCLRSPSACVAAVPLPAPPLSWRISMSARPSPRPCAQLHRELVVGHVLVHVTLVAAEHRIAHAGAAHALEHHLGEQALELLRGRPQRLGIVGLGAAAQRRELLEIVGIDARSRRTRAVPRVSGMLLGSMRRAMAWLR